jgi:hypothetical protein
MQKGKAFMVRRKLLITLAFSMFFGATIGIAAVPKVIRKRGEGNVQLWQYDNGHWQMRLNGRPYFIKGVVYEPVRVGERLTESNMWMNYDFNHNDRPDTAYDAWVDKNLNNLQDKDEPAIGDFQLLKEMGCNTIRIYLWRLYVGLRRKLGKGD